MRLLATLDQLSYRCDSRRPQELAQLVQLVLVGFGQRGHHERTLNCPPAWTVSLGG